MAPLSAAVNVAVDDELTSALRRWLVVAAEELGLELTRPRRCRRHHGIRCLDLEREARGAAVRVASAVG